MTDCEFCDAAVADAKCPMCNGDTCVGCRDAKSGLCEECHEAAQGDKRLCPVCGTYVPDIGDDYDEFATVCSMRCIRQQELDAAKTHEPDGHEQHEAAIMQMLGECTGSHVTGQEIMEGRIRCAIARICDDKADSQERVSGGGTHE